MLGAAVGAISPKRVQLSFLFNELIRLTATSNADMTPAPRVALVTIARNEAHRIGRLLASVRPWVDEMLVLDTGSTDSTLDVARRAGAKVATFSWCDDFSAARNAALAKVNSPWRLVLDADEWLVDGGPQLRRIAEESSPFVGTVVISSDTGTRAGGVSSSRLSRWLPAGVKYSGRVHEQPQHCLPMRPLPVWIDHDGYLPQALREKAGRNRRLLELEIDAHPEDAYLTYQAGKDAQVYDDHARAIFLLSRAAHLAPSNVSWRHDLEVRLLQALVAARRYSEAMEVAEAAISRFADSPDIHFTVADCALTWACEEPSQAVPLLSLAEASWNRCLQIGERPFLAGAVAGRGSQLAAHNLALLLEGTGRAKEAHALRLRYELQP